MVQAEVDLTSPGGDLVAWVLRQDGRAIVDQVKRLVWDGHVPRESPLAQLAMVLGSELAED